ncbi:hypothetical protein CL684_02335 [Candidatus Campbellbacteria bacterium]|nr:hypothetical protein [Candidatus Campbellbacteria bacterium]
MKIIKKIIIFTVLLFLIVSIYSFRWMFEPSSKVENYDEILVSQKGWKKIHPILGKRRINCENFSFDEKNNLELSTCFPLRGEAKGDGISWSIQEDIISLSYKKQNLFKEPIYFNRSEKVEKINSNTLVLRDGIRFSVYKSY